MTREVRDERITRTHVAKLEAQGAAGVAALSGLARDGDDVTTPLALRGLARVNTGEAGRALIAFASSPDGAAAAQAIGLASALDEPGIETTTLRTDALISTFRSRTDATGTQRRAEVIEALGRAGDLRALPILASALASTEPGAAAAAAIALGRFGRRTLAIDAVSRAALVTATHSKTRDVRYGAVYALRLDVTPVTAGGAASDPVAAALVERVADDDAEVRAQAIIALAKRDEVEIGRAAIEKALTDRDWRVAVEAARALGGEHGGDAGHAAVIAAVPRWAAQLAADPTAAHVVMEALRGLSDHDKTSPTLVPMLRALAVPAAAPPIVRGWITCMAIAARARHKDATLAEVTACSPDLPDHLRLPLVAELLDKDVGDAAARRAVVGALLAHADVRVRGAGLGALAAIWPDGTPEEHRAAIATLASAIASTDAALVSAATDAVPGLAKLATPAEVVELDAAIVARAAHEEDPELSASLLELIGTRKLVAGVESCRAALHGHPVRAKAAETCLRQLGEPVPASMQSVAGPKAAIAPPVELATVIGKRVRWHLQTSRGEIVIALNPEVAPWAVAVIAALTQQGFYDKQELHRVVPDFVAQGGDPTGTGAGGPGYTLPAEASTMADGAGFVTGGVGMADAGPASAGSQWFIMHSRAAHLDGRYTWVGAVEAGQKVADSLVIGDSVVRATIEIGSPAKP